MGSTAFYFVLLNLFMGGNADTCARQWLQYQGNCYGYFDSKLTWHEAEIECQSYDRGAHLASILTVAETLVVSDHITAYQMERSSVWIGLHDIRHNGKWRWADESAYNYKSWILGEPNNQSGGEFCVELLNLIKETQVPSMSRILEIEERPIKPKKDFTKWKAVPCHKQNAYICKHEL